MRGDSALATIYPVVNLVNVAGKVSKIVLSRIIHNMWLAVTCSGAAAVSSGDVVASIKGVRQAAFEHGSIPSPVTFPAVKSVPEGGWSQPV